MNDAQEFLGQTIEIRIDRAIGSKHPKLGYEYPVNYGFVPGTSAADGEELDAYVLGVATPLETFSGICIAFIHRFDDDDDKLIVVPEGAELSDEEIRQATDFQEKFFKSIIIRPADDVA